MHFMPQNTDGRIDRAGVAKRAIFATRKSLNSQMVQNLKSPFSNLRARTSKLYEHSRQTPLETYSSEQPALPNSR
jgi:hypothetical protein